MRRARRRLTNQAKVRPDVSVVVVALAQVLMEYRRAVCREQSSLFLEDDGPLGALAVPVAAACRLRSTRLTRPEQWRQNPKRQLVIVGRRAQSEPQQGRTCRRRTLASRPLDHALKATAE